ncbi:hypothetical protein Y038_6067 [Burkholderia pseudomallei MSHR543]|nr:hypothetical protein Y038_6067 [Burkholderia pseudomallei MSHR543]
MPFRMIGRMGILVESRNIPTRSLAPFLLF